MPLLEGKTPAERKKAIWAIGLCAAAFLVLAYNFGLFSSRRSAPRNQNNSNTQRTGVPTLSGNVLSPATVRQDESEQTPPQPVIYQSSSQNVSEAGRNIFAFYVPPVRSPATNNANVQIAPIQTPTPIPPSLVLASVSPPSVYAQTSGFRLEVTGDRFTPETRIYLNGSELPTEFRSPQQLAANVSAQMIASAGQREIIVRTPDNSLFSNLLAMNVIQPPTPQYDYVGYQGRGGSDTAVLRDKRNNELVNVQRGDLVGGRFRVLGISRRSVEFVDREINLRHSVAYSDARSTDTSRPAQPQPIAEEDY